MTACVAYDARRGKTKQLRKNASYEGWYNYCSSTRTIFPFFSVLSSGAPPHWRGNRDASAYIIHIFIIILIIIVIAVYYECTMYRGRGRHGFSIMHFWQRFSRCRRGLSTSRAAHHIFWSITRLHACTPGKFRMIGTCSLLFYDSPALWYFYSLCQLNVLPAYSYSVTYAAEYNCVSASTAAAAVETRAYELFPSVPIRARRRRRRRVSYTYIYWYIRLPTSERVCVAHAPGKRKVSCKLYYNDGCFLTF